LHVTLASANGRWYDSADMDFQPALIRPRSSDWLERWGERISWVVFTLCWVALAAQTWPAPEWLVSQDWVTPVFLTVAAWVTVQTVCKELPLQNVVLAAAIIGGLGGVAHWLSQISGVPLGPIAVGDVRGHSPFQEWVPGVALLWVIAVLNARGVVRWGLRNRAGHPSHGLRVIGLSTGLVVLMATGLEPYATVVHRLWLWGPTRLPFDWHGVPISCLVGWGTVSLIALMAAMPALINKHPTPPGPRPEPLLIWVSVNGLFVLSGMIRDLPDVAVVSGVGLIWPILLLAQAGAEALRAGRKPSESVDRNRGEKPLP